MRNRRPWSFCRAALLALLAGGSIAAASYAPEAGATSLIAATPDVSSSASPDAARADARIVLSARDDCWVRVRDAAGETLFQGTLRAGESYRVPNQEGLLLTTGSARVLDVIVDGKVAPSLGARGAVRRNIPLDPDRLLAGAFNKAEPADITSAKAAPAKAEPVALRQPAAPPAPANGTSPPAAAPAGTSKERPARLSRDARSRAAVIPANGTVRAADSRSSTLRLDVDKGILLRLDRLASTVFVADPEIADVHVKSASLIYVFGKRPGETVLYAVDNRDRVLLNTTISVSHNLRRLREVLARLMPDNGVEVLSIDGALVLSGTVGSAVEAENARRLAERFAPGEGEIINRVEVVAPNQINLRVRIAEMSRDIIKAFGFNLDAVAEVGEFDFAIATGSQIFENDGRIIRGITPEGGLLNSFFGAYNSEDVSINGLIDALETEGLITILAEPNLTAMSGETASFLAGGEFPIPVSAGDEEIKITFKEFGVSLAFTPTILAGGRINLHVRPEVSQLTSVGAVEMDDIVIPALTTRRAETTVELGSGQSFAIAGLLQNNTAHDISKVPGLGNLPVLGTLFRSDRFQRNETELVIIVTPYIVEPVSSKALATPLDGFTPPTDIERIIGGLNYRQRLSQYEAAPRIGQGRGLIGPAGFELE